jgi:hypothetical protein
MHVELTGRSRVFPGRVDVEWAPKDVFEPGVVVLLNAHLHKVGPKRIIGAPDLVVEIASPSAIHQKREGHAPPVQAGHGLLSSDAGIDYSRERKIFTRRLGSFPRLREIRL